MKIIASLTRKLATKFRHAGADSTGTMEGIVNSRNLPRSVASVGDNMTPFLMPQEILLDQKSQLKSEAGSLASLREAGKKMTRDYKMKRIL